LPVTPIDGFRPGLRPAVHMFSTGCPQVLHSLGITRQVARRAQRMTRSRIPSWRPGRSGWRGACTGYAVQVAWFVAGVVLLGVARALFDLAGD